MPRHCEEEIKGPVDNSSQALFSGQIERLRRPKQLPKRYRQELDPLLQSTPTAPQRKKRKATNQRQPTVQIAEDEVSEAEEYTPRKAPKAPAKEFQINIENEKPAWVDDWCKLGKKKDRFEFLTQQIHHLDSNTFSDRIPIKYRAPKYALISCALTSLQGLIFDLGIGICRPRSRCALRLVFSAIVCRISGERKRSRIDSGSWRVTPGGSWIVASRFLIGILSEKVLLSRW